MGLTTAFPVFMGSQPIPFHLADATYDLFGTVATKQVDNIRRLWAGDVNADGVIKYSGVGKDRDPILQNVGAVVPTRSHLKIVLSG
jgi:hypothetical protein